MRHARERRKALIASALLHGVLFLLVFFGLPELFSRKPEPEPLVLTVDILPVKDITNVPTSLEKPSPEPKKEEKKEESKKPTPHVVTQEAPPPPPPQENPAPPKPKKEEEKKPKEDKDKDKKKDKKPKDDDLLAVLKAVKQEAKKDQGKPTKDKKSASSTRTHSEIPYNPNLPLSVTVKDSIRQQLYKCWSVDAGAKDAYKLIVTIDIWLNKDGSLVDSQFTSDTKAKMAADPIYRAAAERAERAIHLCSPLTGLPADKYEAWSYMEFTFDPSEMLY